MPVLAGSIVLVLAACENPDYSGVEFRPFVPKPDAYRTAVRGYVFERRPREIVWGNEFLYHAQTLEEQEYQPAFRARVTLDEVFPTEADRGGQFGFQSLEPGFHSLKVLHGDRTYETLVRAVKGQLTMVAIEIDREGRVWASETSVDHTFLTPPILRELIQAHQRTQALVDAYGQARARGAPGDWDRLLTPDYSDPQGGREDFIRAMVTAGRRAGRRFRHGGFRSTLTPDGARVVLKVAEPGRVDFHELLISRPAEPKDPLRIRTVRL